MAPNPTSSAPTRPGPDPGAVSDLLHRFLAQTITGPALSWVNGEMERQRAGIDERRLGIALGLTSSKVGRADLSLSPEDTATAAQLRADWQPQWWAADEAARVAILLSTYRGDPSTFAARVDKLCTTAEVTEYVAYLKGFAVFPAGDALEARAREGVRSSIGPVFAAIASHNPYPFDYFDTDAWNQMVVKCVFIGAPIETVVGLNQRRNPDLIAMMRDLVAERHAAGRPLPDAVHRYISTGL
jgi:hypothetical protein